MQNHRWLRTPAGTAPRISFGADYNPDQWPREVWDEDVRLMKAAGVDVVSVAIFSWAKLQPGPDTWDFDWLDELIDLLHANGIGVDLATATASPPPWLTTAHPEVLPVTADGTVLSQGGRQHWRPTSPVFREHALAIVTKLAERYGSHPGVVAWHVNNELGCHNAYDYSDDAARAFRVWLEERYGSIAGLNHAWGTAFWSQAYSAFDEILPPRVAAAFPNPTQQLDFLRFSSDALIDHLVAEREILNRISPDIPVTTNFMVVGETSHADFAKMAGEIDFVSNDHYVVEGRDELAFSAAITSGFARHRPWYLMEHSTSAVNWQPINRPKRPGELIRDSLTHVAHG
ncbi:MAG: beta-galactosidase, partial [Candidatus Microbacterium stercoravium]